MKQKKTCQKKPKDMKAKKNEWDIAHILEKKYSKVYAGMLYIVGGGGLKKQPVLKLQTGTRQNNYVPVVHTGVIRNNFNQGEISEKINAQSQARKLIFVYNIK